MDCPAEEHLIRIRIESLHGIHSLRFDLADRKLFVFHEGPVAEIEKALDNLNMDSKIISSKESLKPEEESGNRQRKTLWIVLVINFLFFVIEMTTGLLSKSMGLIADSLDMLADAFVYAISLYAVGGSIARKKNVARMAGYFQIILAAIGLLEVLRRFFFGEEMPDFRVMIIVSLFALIANVICLYLLHKIRSKEAHMQASMIFTSNDVIINLGVILAGVLVLWLESGIPDLVIGSMVFMIVMRGAFRILSLAR